MAVTRNFLKGMGLTEEQVGAIIDEHVDTVNSLKADRDRYKAEAEKLPEIQKRAEELEAKQGKPDEWKEKFEKEHKDFEAFKSAQTAKETRSAKEAAYTALLKEERISEKAYKLILNATKIDELELDADGKTLKDANNLKEAIKADYADFVTKTSESGAETKTPPENKGGTFEKMTLSEKMAYANEHPNDEQVKAWLK